MVLFMLLLLFRIVVVGQNSNGNCFFLENYWFWSGSRPIVFSGLDKYGWFGCRTLSGYRQHLAFDK